MDGEHEASERSGPVAGPRAGGVLVDVSARHTLVARVEEELSAFATSREDGPPYTVFHLAPPPAAEYAFNVCIYDDGEPQLGARLSALPDSQFFWTMPFETPDWRVIAARDAAFFETLACVLNHPTKVIQTRGLLWWRIWCEYKRDDAWTPLRGITIGRWVAGVPRITGRRREYCSPQLLRAA